MKQILVMVCTAVIFVCAVAGANAATLRGQAEIVGDRVVLGDLFAGLDEARAATVIAQSPPPGRSVTLTADWLTRVARAYQIAWTPDSRYQQVTVRRLSHRMGSEAVTEAIRAELGDRAPTGRIDIQLDNLALEIHLPTDVLPSLRIQNFAYDGATGRFAGVAVAPADGTPVVRVPLSGRVVGMVEVPVVTSRIGPDAVIAATDIAWIEVAADRVGSGVVMDAETLVGLSPRRTLMPDEPIRRHEVAAPIAVERGATVTMVVQSGALVLTARGRALDEGAEGDAIRVINIDSNKTVQAIVTGPDTVTVPLGGGATFASLN